MHEQINMKKQLERSLWDIVLGHFQEKGWQFTQLKEQSALLIPLRGNSGEWLAHVRVREGQQQVSCYSILPLKVPELKRMAVAEFITRVNYDMIIGNFELDLRDGEVRYKTALEIEQGQTTEGLLDRLVYANMMVMDRYLLSLMSVIYGSVSPEEAAEQALAQD
jgi:hypothetical protein